MGISDLDNIAPFHMLQIIFTLTSLIICLVYFAKEVIREFPMIVKILKFNEEEEIDE